MNRRGRPKLLPDHSAIPGELKSHRVYLRPLRIEDVKLDYAAVMESAARLRRWGGGSWPEPDFTLAGNLADLARHQREHDSSEAFTYTVMNPEQTRCLGCVYLEPVSRWSRHAEETVRPAKAESSALAAVVRFWVRTSELPERLDGHLFEALRGWLEQEWPFTTVYYLTNQRLESQQTLFRSGGLQEAFSVSVAGKQGLFNAFVRPEAPTDTSADKRLKE